MCSWKSLTGFAVSMCMCSPWVNAQTPPTELGYSEEVVTVGTRTERTLTEVAAVVDVIDAERIERELARDIADLVRFEPGVSVGGTGSRFGLAGFNIRGIGGNRVLTIVDGIRIPEEFSFGPFLSAQRDFVDIDSLDRVEIARGPSSSLYGSDALGGVVLLTTKGPRDFVTADDPFHAALKTGYSSADDSFVGTATVAAGNETVAGLVTYTARRGHDTNTNGSLGGDGPAREDPDPQDVHVDNLIAKLSLVPAEGHEVLLTVDQFSNQTESVIRSDLGFSRGVLLDSRETQDERDRTRWSLTYRYEGSRKILDTFSATFYRQDSENSQLTNDQRVASGGPQTRFRRSQFDQEITGGLLQFGKTLGGDAVSHRLTWGADFYQTDNESLRTGATFDVAGAPVTEFFPFPTRDFPPTEVENSAFFVQDEISLMGGRWLITPGLRYDRFEARATADTFFIEGNPGTPLPEDYDDAEFTLTLGSVFAINERHSVFARYSEGFRAPPYDDVNVGFSNFVGGYKTISNASLESESSEGVEFGYRYNTGAIRFELSAFRNDYENFIEPLALAPQFLATGGIDPADGLTTFQSVNLDEVVIEGVELKADIALAALVEALQGFSLRAAIAYADGEDRSRNEPINSVNPLTTVVGVGFDASSGRWGLELIATGVQAKEESDIDSTSGRLATGGYGILDLLAYYDVSQSVSLNVGLFNLTDRRYIRWADTAGIDEFDAANRFSQPGFNAAATLRFEF